MHTVRTAITIIKLDGTNPIANGAGLLKCPADLLL